MTPASLRAAIPVLEETAYLNTGASGPSPRRVVDAVEHAVEHQEYEVHVSGDPYEYAADVYDEARHAVARLIGAAPDEIALTNSTTDGINVVASAIDWEPRDVVVRTDLEHPAGILPWERLASEYGVEIRVVESEAGRIPEDEFREAVAGAQLVCLSALTWSHGTRLPVAALTDLAHDAGAQVLVDAVQVPGQRPMDVSSWGAEFVAAAGHKWLLGPWGAGFLYVRRDVAADLTPGAVGYRSVEAPDQSPFAYKPHAGRFEVGTASPAPYAGLVAAIDVIEDVGIETIAGRIEDLSEYLVEGLADERLLSPHHPESGLVTFRVDDPDATVERLAANGVVIRSVPWPGAVRASVHAFNTRDDLDALLDGLDRSGR